MIVKAAILGGQRGLDQMFRQVLDCNRLAVQDAAATDHRAGLVHEGH